MKHRRKPPGAAPRPVFVDETGRRVRRTQLLYRTLVLAGLGGLAALVVSVLGGVPLPGLTAPVHLPSDEPAHPRGAPSTLSSSRVGAASPPFAPVAGSSGSAATNAADSPVASSPSATRAAVRSTVATHGPTASQAPTRTTGATPTRTTGATPTRTTGATPTRTTGATPTRTTGATPTHSRPSSPGAPSTHSRRGHRPTPSPSPS